MRHHVVLFAATALGACDKASVVRRDAPPVSPAVVQFLLTSAATDFRTHGPSHPLRFRSVRVGHFTAASGEDQYLLCGEFSPVGEGKTAGWTPFVTLKTSGYEQYLGAQAEATYCQRPSITWDTGSDLSALLQGRVDSLR